MSNFHIFSRRPCLTSIIIKHVPSYRHIGLSPSPPRPSCHTSRAMSLRSDSEHEDFFRYSGGRWLWDEATQLRSRYKRFNVPELKRISAQSVGANACVSMTKLAEGGF